MDSRPREVLRIYLIGVFMGAADAVPGVSGGTIAFIAGIYSRLIDAIAAINSDHIRRFLSSCFPPDLPRLRAVLVAVDAGFLLTLLAGIVTSLVLVTRFVVYLEGRQPVLLFGFFFGLIAIAVVILARQVTLTGSRHYLVAIVGFVVSFLLSGNLTLLEGHGPILVFVAGVVAISAMILPGISGALILVILGQYVFLSTTLTAFTDGIRAVLLDGGSLPALVEPGTTVVIFLLGALVGVLTIARIVDYALERAPMTTFVFLVSLVVGALRAPVVEIQGRGIPWTTETIGAFIGAAVVGALILAVLDYFAMDITIESQ